MKKHGHKLIFSIIVICCSVVILLQIPFCRFHQIGCAIYSNATASFYEKLLMTEERISLYWGNLFLIKGTKYRNIPFSNHKFYDIKFNWDNSITIAAENFEYRLRVDSIEVRPETFKVDSYEKLFTTKEDSIYKGIEFWDVHKNALVIYRQKKAMKYPRKRDGFEIVIHKDTFYTGKKSYFDY